jgi:hypothetical protein
MQLATRWSCGTSIASGYSSRANVSETSRKIPVNVRSALTDRLWQPGRADHHLADVVHRTYYFMENVCFRAIA